LKTNLLFIYGSLLSRGVNHHLLLEQGAIPYSLNASIKGELYLIEWYPGLVLQENKTVIGEVYQLNDPEKAFTYLDEYEGADDSKNPEYERVIVPVKVDDRFVECWTYIYLHPVDRSSLIPNGDFISHLNSKKSNFD
jgi:gamma-glutamylcyclotransferase (GGCT)/AIG2-like uncharacterized protein YtfP